MSDSLQPHGLCSPWNSPGQNTGVGSLSLLQQIFVIQKLNQCLLQCRWILYQLSYQGIGINIYILLYTEQTINKKLLHSIGNSTQYSVINYIGKESEREWIYVYV